jgi:hypothetical protein
MVRDGIAWAEWESRYTASQPVDFRRNMELLEAMYDYARFLGVFPPANALEGLETDIRVAKELNAPIRSRLQSDET